jgi:hypothetical protein
MKRIGLTSVYLGALLASAVPLAHAGQRPRPTDVPGAEVAASFAPNELQIYNDYGTAALVYASRRAVVHYVATGIDAPPLNDDDSDGVPDYVEHIGTAADVAIDYYERRGFAAILPDEAGPDARPDIYISRLTPGYFGVALPASQARGGAFVVVSNALDPSPGRSLGSLYGTIAHELFHLVQFSYFPSTEEPEIPDWVLEGTAAAMEDRVYAGLDDIVASLQLRRWFDKPQVSLTEQTYGSQLLWRYLDERQPRLLPRYLRRLAGHRSEDQGAAGLAATYARVSGHPFAAAFGRFAAWIAGEYASRITPLRTLPADGRQTGRIEPLAIHVLRLPRSARAIAFHVTRGRPNVTLTYELESEYAGHAAATRLLRGRAVNGALVFTIPQRLRRNPRLAQAALVVSNGDPSRPGAYSVAISARASRSS